MPEIDHSYDNSVFAGSLFFRHSLTAFNNKINRYPYDERLVPSLSERVHLPRRQVPEPYGSAALPELRRLIFTVS